MATSLFFRSVFVVPISATEVFLAIAKGFLALWPMWLLIGLIIVLKVVYKIWEKQRLIKSGITEIDRIKVDIAGRIISNGLYE